MVFNSVSFLIFFVLILGLYQLPISWTWRKVILVFSSYYFYAAFNIAFLPILMFTTVLDWFTTTRMGRCRSQAARRGYLLLSLCSSLGLLSFFKYGNFLQQNAVQLLGSLGIQYQPFLWHLVLPPASRFTPSSRSPTRSTFIAGRTLPRSRSWISRSS